MPTHTKLLTQSLTRPLFKTLSAAVLPVLLSVLLTACGASKWGFPYRANVQQGNWITAEQLARLETGMNRLQVRFVLGTPVLQDSLHADRWDYAYYNKPGYGKEELRHLTIWFENDLLVRWHSDAQPDRQPFERTDSGAGSVVGSQPDSQPNGQPDSPPNTAQPTQP